jgi:hypothetical protein
MADYVKAGASAALCVAGKVCAFDTVGKPLPSNLQARQEIFDTMFNAKVEALLGEPLDPLEIFGPLTMAQIENRIRILEILAFEAELEGKRLKDVPLAKRMINKEAISEGKKHLFSFDSLEIAQQEANSASAAAQRYKDAKRLLQDPTTQIWVTTPGGAVRASETFVGKAKAFAVSNTGKATIGIGALALIWVLTRGD